MNEFYVYAICDPRKPMKTDFGDYQPIYIGKGKNDRYMDHLKEAQGICKVRSEIKAQMIGDVYKSGLEPIVIFICKGMDEKSAYDIEIEYIKKFGRYGLDENGILSNRITDQRSLGGGKKGMKHKKPRSKEHIQKIKKYRTGQTWSDEQKERRCGEGNPMFGKKMSDETRKKMSESHSGEKGFYYGKSGTEHPVTGFKHSEEEREKRSKRMSKSWKVITPDGEQKIVHNLTAFCKEISVPYSRIYQSCGGWICEEIKNV